MSLEGVTQIETELEYTVSDQRTLQKVKLVWDRLSASRRNAIKRDEGEGQYRDLLRKTLVQARARQTVDDVEERSAAFWAWYEERCAELGIRELERDRGLPHQAWCERWLPEDYQVFEAAVGLVVTDPTALHFEALEAAAMRLLRCYVGVFRS